jgi:hypothetical protein
LNRDYETQHRIQAIKRLKKIKDDEEEKIKDEKLRNEERIILRNEKEKEKEHEMDLERTVNHNSTLIESMVRKLQMIDLDGKETRCTHTLSHTRATHTPPHFTTNAHIIHTYTTSHKKCTQHTHHAHTHSHRV